jgi:hypothetical protein
MGAVCSLSLASLASALLPLVAVVRKAVGFYAMPGEAHQPSFMS